MTSFHDLLVRYINERKVAVARMAEYCGLERSSLYRILRGQRTPANEELVRQMAAYLCLNPAEEDDLLLAYRVELIGYEKYYRRQFIDDFIRNFHTTKVGNDLYTPIITPMEDRPIFAQPMDNRSDVIKTFSNAVVSECSKPEGGNIRMFIPPDPEFMNILIRAADNATVPVRIDHLIQLHQSESAVAASVENFHMILDTLPLISDMIDYRPYYFYSEVIPRLPLFYPYQCFTANSVFWLSEDLCGGLAVHHPTIFPFMASQFDRTLKHCRKLYEAQAMGSFRAKTQAMKLTNAIAHSMTHMISYPPLSVDQETAAQHLSSDFPDPKSVIQLFAQDLDSFQQLYTTYCRQLICSRAGLEHFAKTGRIPRYASDAYFPLTPEERVAILSRLETIAENVDFRFLRRDIYNYNDGLSIILGENLCCLEIYFSTTFSKYLIIEEPNFIEAFRDYFDSLDTQDLYSAEESINILKQIIEDTKQLS